MKPCIRHNLMTGTKMLEIEHLDGTLHGIPVSTIVGIHEFEDCVVVMTPFSSCGCSHKYREIMDLICPSVYEEY